MSFKIGWFSTGKDRQARVLLQKAQDAIKRGKIGDIKICYIFCNREWGEEKESDRFIKLAREMDIPLICFSSRKFKPDLRKKALEEAKRGNFEPIKKWRILYDRQVLTRIQEYRVEVIFLAGYMLILGDELCKKFTILNLHPALPEGPKGTWQQVIWDLIKKEEDQTGIMIHQVTPQLDAGPALTYCKFSIKGERFDPLWDKIRQKLTYKTFSQIQKEEGEKEPLFSAIRGEQKKREIPLVLATLDFLAQGRLNLKKLKKPILLEV